jgi:ribokinase
MAHTEPRVLVAGSINMDIVATVDRHPVPGETLPGLSLSYFPGGKGANQAVAAARANGTVSMIGGLGEDGFADELLSFLKSNDIDTQYVSRKDAAPTGTALIIVDSSGENSIVVVPGANGELTSNDVKRVDIAKGDVLVAQFETPPETTTSFFRSGRQAGATCILNPAPAGPISEELLKTADVLVVNEIELASVTDLALSESPTEAEIAEGQHVLRDRGFDGILVVTLGERGAIAMIGSRSVLIDGREVSVVDTTGAGDCFVGYLASGLASGHDIDMALNRANVAASLCVQRAGAGPSMPTASEVAAIN